MMMMIARDMIATEIRLLLAVSAAVCLLNCPLISAQQGSSLPQPPSAIEDGTIVPIPLLSGLTDMWSDGNQTQPFMSARGIAVVDSIIFFTAMNDANCAVVAAYDSKSRNVTVLLGSLNSTVPTCANSSASQSSTESHDGSSLATPSAVDLCAVATIDVVATSNRTFRTVPSSITVIIGLSMPLSHVLQVTMRYAFGSWAIQQLHRAAGTECNFTQVMSLDNGQQPSLAGIPPPTDARYRRSTGEIFIAAGNRIYRITPDGGTVHTYVGTSSNNESTLEAITRPAYRLNTTVNIAGHMTLLGDHGLIVPEVRGNVISAVSFTTGIVSLIAGVLNPPYSAFVAGDACLTSRAGCNASSMPLWAVHAVAALGESVLFAASAAFPSVYRIDLATNTVRLVGGVRPSTLINDQSTDRSYSSSGLADLDLPIRGLAVDETQLYLTTPKGVAAIPLVTSGGGGGDAVVDPPAVHGSANEGASSTRGPAVSTTLAAGLSCGLALTIIGAVIVVRRRRVRFADPTASQRGDALTSGFMQRDNHVRDDDYCGMRGAASCDQLLEDEPAENFSPHLDSARSVSSEGTHPTARGHRGRIGLPGLMAFGSARSLTSTAFGGSAPKGAPLRSGPFDAACSAVQHRQPHESDGALPQSLLDAARQAVLYDDVENSADYQDTVASSSNNSMEVATLS